MLCEIKRYHTILFTCEILKKKKKKEKNRNRLIDRQKKRVCQKEGETGRLCKMREILRD